VKELVGVNHNKYEVDDDVDPEDDHANLQDGSDGALGSDNDLASVRVRSM